MSTSSAISHARQLSISSASSVSSSRDIVVFRGRRAEASDLLYDSEGCGPVKQIMTDFNVYDSHVNVSNLMQACGTALLEVATEGPALVASLPLPPVAAKPRSQVEDDSLYEVREELESNSRDPEAHRSNRPEANTRPETQQTQTGTEILEGAWYEANFQEKPLTFTPPKEQLRKSKAAYPNVTKPNGCGFRLMTSPVIHIYVGKGRKPYKLPKKLACFHSYYFRGLCSTYDDLLDSHYDHEEYLHDIDDFSAFEAVKDYMLNHKIDVRASGLSLADIMLRFLRVYIMVQKLDIVPRGDLSGSIYSTLHDHMNKLYETNGRVLSEEYIGLAIERLPPNTCPVILNCVARTLCENPAGHLSDDFIDRALMSCHANHPDDFRWMRNRFGKNNVTLDIYQDLTEKEQVELAIKRSLKGDTSKIKEDAPRYRF